MKVIDLNILLCAINRDAPHHAAARQWLEAVLSGEEPVALPRVVVLGFLRLSTNPRVLPRPLTPEQALAVMEEWLSRPCVRTLDPSDDHRRVLRALLDRHGLREVLQAPPGPSPPGRSQGSSPRDSTSWGSAHR